MGCTSAKSLLFALDLHHHCTLKIKVDPLAQLVEHNTFNVGVLGSSPKRITEKRGSCLSFLCFLIGLPKYSPAKSSNEDAHEGTDDIEETIRKIGQRGNTEDSRLCHSTGVPRNQYGSNSG